MKPVPPTTRWCMCSLASLRATRWALSLRREQQCEPGEWWTQRSQPTQGCLQVAGGITPLSVPFRLYDAWHRRWMRCQKGTQPPSNPAKRRSNMCMNTPDVHEVCTPVAQRTQMFYVIYSIGDAAHGSVIGQLPKGTQLQVPALWPSALICASAVIHSSPVA